MYIYRYVNEVINKIENLHTYSNWHSLKRINLTGTRSNLNVCVLSAAVVSKTKAVGCKKF